MRLDVVVCDLECPECGVYGPHRFDGEEAVCTTCGIPREVEPELIASVLDMQFCAWCRETLPARHECRPDPTPCQSRTQLGPCGICDICKAAMNADPRYGSPSDLYGGE